MRIKCPYCGERSLDEFAFHGDAAQVRPDPSAAAAADEFYAFTYERENTAGVSSELWQHLAGCRSWLVVTRNVVTHEISGVASARQTALARRAITAGDDA